MENIITLSLINNANFLNTFFFLKLPILQTKRYFPPLSPTPIEGMCGKKPYVTLDLMSKISFLIEGSEKQLPRTILQSLRCKDPK